MDKLVKLTPQLLENPSSLTKPVHLKSPSCGWEARRFVLCLYFDCTVVHPVNNNSCLNKKRKSWESFTWWGTTFWTSSQLLKVYLQMESAELYAHTMWGY